MDDLSVFSTFFYSCLRNLGLILCYCVETNLVLNQEKCHFIIKRRMSLAIEFLQKVWKWIVLKSPLLRSYHHRQMKKLLRVSWVMRDSAGVLSRIFKPLRNLQRKIQFFIFMMILYWYFKLPRRSLYRPLFLLFPIGAKPSRCAMQMIMLSEQFLANKLTMSFEQSTALATLSMNPQRTTLESRKRCLRS